MERYQIFNSLGQVVAENKISGNYVQIDVSNYASGVYFVNLVDDLGMPYSHKLIRK